MLCGLLPPSDGTLRVAGFDLRTRGGGGARADRLHGAEILALRRSVGPREPALLQQRLRTARGAATRPHRLGADASSISAPAAEAKSGDLPLGFKQRLALACALMHEPDILFLDEPTSGVDPLARREFWRRINALAEAGVTILVTTHFMEEAEYCDRLAIMAQGRILAEARRAGDEDAGAQPGQPRPDAWKTPSSP